MKKSIPIHAWPDTDRPREKLLRHGEKSLTNSELLAILLRTGIHGLSAIDLARTILERFGTFRNMAHTDMRDWHDLKGIGDAKVCQIKAAIEIGRRFREDETRIAGAKISASQDVVNILMPQMRDLKNELFKVVYLNGSNTIIDIIEQGNGTVNHATPIIREIFHEALQKYAVSIICVHNHPSGDIKPSKEDERFTYDLVCAGKIMNITVLDHIIIGDNMHFSFAEEGLL